MLHVTCDVIGIVQHHFFEIQDGGHLFFTLSLSFTLFCTFFSQFVLENVRSRTETVLVTIIALSVCTLNFR